MQSTKKNNSLSHKVVLIMGSKVDLKFAVSIGRVLDEYKVDYEYRIASAHKTPEHLLNILKENEQSEDNIVYITVAGLSDALSGFVAGFTRYPVIACPPDSDRSGWSKIYSSVMTPPGVSVSLVLKPENAALAAVKILALSNPVLCDKIKHFMQVREEEVEKSDFEVMEKKVSELMD